MNTVYFVIVILPGIIFPLTSLVLGNHYFNKLEKHQIRWYSKISYNSIIIWATVTVLKNASSTELIPLLGVMTIFAIHIYFLFIGLRNLS